jgi:hypothetical protein
MNVPLKWKNSWADGGPICGRVSEAAAGATLAERAFSDRKYRGN